MVTDADARGEGQTPPQLGPARPVFGLAKDQGRRIEVTLVFEHGGMMTAIQEMDDALTAESLQAFAEQLAKDIDAEKKRMFTDGWATSGQHAWVDLGEVVAFSLRPAK